MKHLCGGYHAGPGRRSQTPACQADALEEGLGGVQDQVSKSSSPGQPSATRTHWVRALPSVQLLGRAGL